MKRARIVSRPNQVVNWLYVAKGRMTKDAETKRNYFRLAVRESSDFGSAVNHPPIAVSTQWVWNSACKSARSLNAAKAASDCTDAGRKGGGIVLSQTIAASGLWSSAHALAAGKPRSRAPRASDHFCSIELCACLLVLLSPAQSVSIREQQTSILRMGGDELVIEGSRPGKVFGEHRPSALASASPPCKAD
jgi:hypothetical protein